MGKEPLFGKLQQQQPLAPYTSWKIGGVADYFYRPIDVADWIRVLQSAAWEEVTILGAATNVLIRDRGVRGLVIYLRHGCNDLVELDEEHLRVGVGVTLAQLVRWGRQRGRAGIAWMAGIPGTLGGALRMNAGAHGESIWSYVDSVVTVDSQGRLRRRSANEFEAGYRHLTGLAPNEWIAEAVLHFAPSDPVAVTQEVTAHLQHRSRTQPVRCFSCGSVFRNPPGDYAARLIESCGFKGYCVGDAQVSERHANFIVNRGAATAVEVESLMQEIVQQVANRQGVTLIPEVQILGEV